MTTRRGRCVLVLAAIGVTAILMSLITGCRVAPPAEGRDLPDDSIVVGGGLKIEWRAPSNGTAYLVEKTTGKIIETRSLKEGDTYSFSITSPNQVSDFERIVGIRSSDMRVLLYFRPARPESPAQ